jgi:hypothetical protein
MQDTLTFDRRGIPRRPIAGRAMAVFTSTNGAGTLVRVELLDASWQGIGVRSPVPVAPGASVSLTPEDAMWPRQIGIVVCCEKNGDGFRLGLRSRLAQAAA